MSVDSSRWWWLPVGIIIVSELIALGIVAFKLSAPQALGATAEICSGERANDYACYQEHYQQMVRGPGVQAAFTELKGAYETNEFLKANCHQLTHVIGRAAVDRYSDLSNTYGRGDSFCWSGYYHGAMEAMVAKIGPEKIVDEANTICADMGEGQQQYSFYHYNCVHGLGHGFMAVLENEVFQSLETCDTLKDKWEKESCFGGVFMENIMAEVNPGNKTKYLKADEPLYPCTAVAYKYKTPCYLGQTSYALKTQDRDFGKVFDLCAESEEDFRATCYQSLGRDASGNSASDVTKTRDTCMIGEDYEARSNCVIGAVKDFISYFHSDTQSKEFCDSLNADLRETCLETAKEYYKRFQV